MNILTSHLTASLLLVQALSGWCYERAELGSPAEAPVVHCCRHDNCEVGHEGQSQEPCQSESECRGFCTYVTSVGPQLDVLQVSLADCVWFVPSRLDSEIIGAPCRNRQADLGLHEPPLRLHLLHQILLV